MMYQFNERGEIFSFEILNEKAEVEVLSKDVGARQTELWSQVPLVIPQLPHSRLDGCALISRVYLLQVII